MPQAVREACNTFCIKIGMKCPGFAGATDVLGMKEWYNLREWNLHLESINKRRFQYTFKMLPKSREEAEWYMK